MAKKKVKVSRSRGSSLESSISNLKSVTGRLNRVTDQVNETFKYIEDYLEDCSIGITADVSCDEFLETDDYDHSSFIEYSKHSGKFRILYVTYYQGIDESRCATPWEELPREIKLKLVRSLPKLLNHITSQVGELVDRVDEAEIAVDEIRSMLIGGM